jgi:hypothetical protein
MGFRFGFCAGQESKFLILALLFHQQIYEPMGSIIFLEYEALIIFSIEVMKSGKEVITQTVDIFVLIDIPIKGKVFSKRCAKMSGLV